MTDASVDYEPVKVRVDNFGEMQGQAPVRYKANYETYVLTANDPVQCILPRDDDRKVAFVQALDNDVVVGTKSQVLATLNTATGVPQPIGAYVPKSNGSPVTLIDNNAVYAGVTTTANNSRVSVIAVSRS